MMQSDPVCGEAGRQMFFEFVGQYFAAPPRLVALPAGTACPLCGARDVPLWRTAAGEPSCLAQQTITRKRAARAAASEPAVPPAKPDGMTAMGDGTMVVAGPARSMIITKLLPNVFPPPSLDLRFSDKGSIRSARLELLNDPPPPPFVAIIFEKNARFRTRITIDHSEIVVNGPSGQVFRRPYLLHLKALAERVGGAALLDMMAIRNRAALGGAVDARQREKDQATILDIRSAGLISPHEFRSLPSPGAAEAAFIRQLYS